MSFVRATTTAPAGGGVPGYRYMLERVADAMAAEHGPRAVADAFQAIAAKHRRADE